VYLAKMPTLPRKIAVAVDWARSIVFPTNVVHLHLARTRQSLQRLQEGAIE
jgi:NADH dehydrogenase